MGKDYTDTLYTKKVVQRSEIISLSPHLASLVLLLLSLLHDCFKEKQHRQLVMFEYHQTCLKILKINLSFIIIFKAYLVALYKTGHACDMHVL